MENSIIIRFLTVFFSLFKADIKEYNIEDNEISGIISWQDENEEQSFFWLNIFDESDLQKLKLICEYLVQNNLIAGDKIIIPPHELLILLQNNGWNNIDAEESIQYLCSIKIKMIENSKIADYFCVHF